MTRSFSIFLFFFRQVSLELLFLHRENFSVATGLEEVMNVLKKDLPSDMTKLEGIKSKVCGVMR